MNQLLAAVRARPALGQHALLCLLFLLSRWLLDLAGMRFNMILDWMFMDDPADLRDRLLHALYYGHAFPPGLNLMTGLLLKASESHLVDLAHALFQLFGLALVNALFYLGRVMGLSVAAAFALSVLFSLLPQTIYFEHLYLYEMPVAALLAVAAALFHAALARGSAWLWFACFLTCTLVGWIRSTFHLVWFCAVAALALWFAAAGERRRILAALAVPAALLGAVYLKNLVVFGSFTALTWTPGIFTTTTIHKLPMATRQEWVKQGKVSPFAAVSMYEGPRAYLPYFNTTRDDRWPPMLNVLDKPTLGTPNFSHWFFLEINKRRRDDALVYLKERPGEYLATVAENSKRFLSAGTLWHPRDPGPDAPHYKHRQVLGGWEALYNRIVHSFPLPPLGYYLFFPLACLWAVERVWILGRQSQGRQSQPMARLRAAVLGFCLLQIAFTTLASVAMTSGESPRYRFQIEAFILLLGALSVIDVWERLRRRRQTRGAVSADAPAAASPP